MSVRLNGWQRLGIIASCLWAIGGALWGNEIGLHEGDWVMQTYAFCLRRQIDWGPCQQALDNAWPDAIRYHWWYAAILGLAPIPLGWLLAYAGVGLVRWVRTGFRHSN
jgi:hypothetical protein